VPEYSEYLAAVLPACVPKTANRPRIEVGKRMIIGRANKDDSSPLRLIQTSVDGRPELVSIHQKASVLKKMQRRESPIQQTNLDLTI
jgi:hypothetical protein